MTAMPPDQFSLPSPRHAQGDREFENAAPLAAPLPGTPSESWQARGLASPAGRHEFRGQYTYFPRHFARDLGSGFSHAGS